MKRYSFAVALIAVLSCGAAAEQDATKDELKRLDGTYKLVRGEQDGKPLTEEAMKNSKLTMMGAKHVVQVGNDAPMIGTHVVNPFEKPKSIDVSDTAGRFEGKLLKGIYKLDGDELTVSFSPPEEARPQEFATQNRPGRFVHTWKRIR